VKTPKMQSNPKGSPKASPTLLPKIGFVESMECLPVSKLPGGPNWSYEIKLDGFRLEAVKSKGKTTLYSPPPKCPESTMME
jgi:ATP-dependent DNA ligase